MYIGINQLLFPDPVAGGMNPYVLMSLAYKFRSTNEDVEPIIVKSTIWAPSTRGVLYEIVEGRHRAVAAMMAGRKLILAKEEEV